MKFRNLRIGTRLYLGFLTIVVFVMIIGFISIYEISNISDSAEKIYNHPFIVSNTVREIQIKILSMRQNEKNVDFADSELKLHELKKSINHLESEVIDLFNLLYERFLGNIDDVKELKEEFINWKPLRDEVIALRSKKTSKVANDAIREKESGYIEKLDRKMRKLVDFANRKAKEFKESTQNHASAIKLIMLVSILVLIFLSLIISILSTRNITEPLKRILSWLKNISLGKLQNQIDINQKDEVGQLAETFREMQNNLLHKAEIAKKVSLGDFSQTVILSSSEDDVALSINEIVNNFSRISNENEKQNWIKTGLNELNIEMRGDLDIYTFGNKVISFLCRYLDSKIGAFYVYQEKEKNLKLIGSFAFHQRKNLSQQIMLGEGLVGQCALEKQIISINEIPEDYFRINSAIGNAYPKNILVIPVLVGKELMGVMEIGSFQEFLEKEHELINQLGEIVGISLKTTLSREITNQLLKETERQAFILQQQQEELRQTNEELEEQANALKKSESLLQQQQEELRVINEELSEKAEELERQKQAITIKNEELYSSQKEVEEKAKNLEAASQYKSEFLANMSHELRTPLNSILILSHLLAKEKTNLTKKQKEYAQTIYSSGNDLQVLIDDILDLSKIEAGKMEIVTEKIYFSDIINNIKNLFSQQAEQKKLGFILEKYSDLPEYFMSDHKRVEQILKNFLSNALKFTQEGKITVQIKRLDEQVIFSVSDTGIGITEEKQKLIFEAFQQADGATNRKYGGTGLGLSISKALAKILGGEIKLESKLNHGSIFSLILPLTGSAKEKLVGEKSEEVKLKKEEIPLVDSLNYTKEIEEFEGHQKKLLIIEDDQKFSGILKDLAEEKGFKTLLAYDGETGMQYVKQFNPHAIILDIGLPGMSGWDVMHKLKEHPETRHIPVHFMSAYDDNIKALNMGAIGFLTKPILPDKLEESFLKIESMIAARVKKLLIIEDDPRQLDSMVNLIAEKDLEIRALTSGKEALKLLDEEVFDSIIVDLGLKDINGFELIEKISGTKNEFVPVIVYTGKDLSEDEEELLQKYTKSIIIKGVKSPERLLDETALFLHRVEGDLPKNKQQIIRRIQEKDKSLNGKKVLIVDDDMRNVFAVTSALESYGMVIIAGRNGIEGIKKLEENPDTEIVLMDIMMPEMDGYETMVHIRKKEKFKNLPIIALTAKAMKGDRIKCIESGANDYLSKPVDMEKLITLLKVWISR